MKYIDADKLKKYIENKREVVCDGLDWEDMDECQRYAVEYLDDILSFITSLQQEQLVNKDLGTLITCDIIEMTAKKAIDKPQDKEKEIELMTKKINYLCSLEENYVQQEQPKINLKKEVKSYIKHNFTITDEIAQIPEEDRRYSMWEDDMVAFARHFWNKWFNARKEK